MKGFERHGSLPSLLLAERLRESLMFFFEGVVSVCSASNIESSNSSAAWTALKIVEERKPLRIGVGLLSRFERNHLQIHLADRFCVIQILEA